ncbi:isochorismate synthase (plasmid) [Streptomyces sp. NBC_01450]|uniref:isochorismate synthase n=1 Tax=Streptomyces sp. NBC_01450 TaxID=2903871 RepID=UPI002E358C2E|nr:isochorismate synthase [Streptomyces sp. NBC_01450]
MSVDTHLPPRPLPGRHLSRPGTACGPAAAPALPGDTAPGPLGRSFHEDLLDVCRRAAAAARREARPVLASCATRSPQPRPIDLWSHGRTQTERSLLWQSAWDGGFLVAFGTAHDVTAHGDSRVAVTRESWQRLSSGAVLGGRPGEGPTGIGPVLVGGFSFAPARTPKGSAWPDGLMWVPALQIRGATAAGTAEVRLNAVIHPGDNPRHVARSLIRLAARCLAAAPPATSASGEPSGAAAALTEIPSAEDWKHLVRRAVGRIGAGGFEKVVLAREVRVTAGAPFDLPAALRRLERTHPHATVFAVGRGTQTFLGATPEYLVRLTGRAVHTLGLAGTAPRGATPEQDAALARELTDSAKTRHEHDVVVRALRDALRATCTHLDEEAPRVVKLPHVQHLSTAVEGRLADTSAGILDLVERLHPTPALGGHPRAQSLDWLADNEGIDRGWYAAPVGWADTAGQGEFAVAIRSGLVDSNTASLYAGCGIVTGSDPEDEYVETCAKLRPMLHALGIG